jgi:hypothetical protein
MAVTSEQEHGHYSVFRFKIQDSRFKINEVSVMSLESLSQFNSHLTTIHPPAPSSLLLLLAFCNSSTPPAEVLPGAAPRMDLGRASSKGHSLFDKFVICIKNAVFWGSLQLQSAAPSESATILFFTIA